MKSLFFDAGPVISLTMNNLLWLIPALKKQFRGEFYVTETVKYELVDKPITSKRFKFEALRTLNLINEGIFKAFESKKIEKFSSDLLELANSIYIAKGCPIKIVHPGEIEAVAAAIKMNADAIVVDERTTKKLIEDPNGLKKILEKKLHTKVSVNKPKLREFKKIVGDVKVIRSFELVLVAYELGLLDKYLPKIDHPDQTLLDAVLWGIKLHGCAVSEQEIDISIAYATRKKTR